MPGKERPCVNDKVLSAKTRQTRAPTEASPTEPTEDGALNDRPVPHREQGEIAKEVANFSR